MEISFDKYADAMYIRFQKGTVENTIPARDDTMIDFDSEGNVIGLEILDASKRFPIETFENIKIKITDAPPKPLKRLSKAKPSKTRIDR